MKAYFLYRNQKSNLWVWTYVLTIKLSGLQTNYLLQYCCFWTQTCLFLHPNKFWLQISPLWLQVNILLASWTGHNGGDLCRWMTEEFLLVGLTWINSTATHTIPKNPCSHCRNCLEMIIFTIYVSLSMSWSLSPSLFTLIIPIT